MCLGVPGKIIDIYVKDGLRIGKIDFGGVTREACLEALPEARIGEYTMIHAGFALNVLSEEEAMETLSTLHELEEFEQEASLEEDGAAG
ncbi:MAG TPA: HypC/HybG/HupF family hydrogenase formation chaperone [Chloroflexi bacterium]|nr:HypC/HybG/HupF family hydrogenase formation chaperone [Chloroflexota bacterium]HPO59215.1 HypC/HybG/HupF family hydrogenase formation chaperone [Anaerolineaceae bacterium]